MGGVVNSFVATGTQPQARPVFGPQTLALFRQYKEENDCGIVKFEPMGTTFTASREVQAAINGVLDGDDSDFSDDDGGNGDEDDNEEEIDVDEA